VIGQSIAHYKVTAKIGAGGMGEVYRATDSKLGRDVALKVLPAAFAQDEQRMARFEREAQVLASLNHSNIAAIYGLEECGTGFQPVHKDRAAVAGPSRILALAMELVEGPTLAERIAQGALPIEEALPIAKQIAEALEYAHDKGIIHRDLKPANLKLTHDGQLKVLDFGLAKALSDDLAAPDISSSPTLSMAATKMGMILGTAAYMSPEQAKGKQVDRRCDVWAFGCVLYEMLSRKQAYAGEDVSETLAAIIRGEPDWNALPKNLPSTIRRVLKRCLEKDVRHRLQSIGEARIAIEDLLVGKEEAISGSASAEQGNPARSTGNGWLATAGIVVVAAALSAWMGYSLGAKQQTGLPVHAIIAPPEKVAFDATGDYGGIPVLAPQGDRVVFSAHAENAVRSLWVRPLDSFSAQRLEGTEGASHPFWSPDGRYIGFFANGKMSKILATGGPVVALANTENPRGGCWCKNDVILFAPNFQGSLRRINASGGTATEVTTIDASKHTTHRWPSCLPDGKHFLYLAASHQGGRPGDNGVYFGALESKEAHLVVPSDAGALYASGFLLHHLQNSLMAQPFDPAIGKVTGEAVTVLDKVKYDTGVWRTSFSVSENGVLAYLPGGSGPEGTQLVWYDRAGKQIGVVGESGTYSDPRLSPDNKRVAFVSGDPIWDVWVLDSEKRTRTRVTFDQNVKAQPAWSPDGRTLSYTVTKIGGGGSFGTIHSKTANGSGSDQTLAAEDGIGFVLPQYSPDGKYLVYLRRQNARGQGIYAKPLEGGEAPFLVVAAASEQSELSSFKISPNGKWIAFASNESGRTQVFISPFPRGEGKWQVSSGIGDLPLWRGDSKELFYWGNSNDLCAVAITENVDGLQVGASQLLFHANLAPVGTLYDVSRDGQRLLLNSPQEQASTSLNLVVNWPATLKKK